MYWVDEVMIGECGGYLFECLCYFVYGWLVFVVVYGDGDEWLFSVVVCLLFGM